MEYIVRTGDSLHKLSLIFKVSIGAIKRANRLANSNIFIGESLIIPVDESNLEMDVDWMSGGSGAPTLAYVVLAGDSLYKIATKFDTTVAKVKQLNGLKNDQLRVGQTLQIPITGSTSQVSLPVTSYIVKSGDSLYKIATKFGTTVETIQQLNNLKATSLNAGQLLKVPTSGSDTSSNSSNLTSYTVVAGDSLYKIATKFETTIAKIKQLNNLSSNALSIGQRLKVSGNLTNTGASNVYFTQYLVQAGDSLYKVATKFNTTIAQLKSINGLDTNSLFVGQKLRIPQNLGRQSGDSVGGNEERYTVKAGDSISLIAWIFDTTTAAIRTRNKLTSDVLHIGQKLIVPVGQNPVLPDSGRRSDFPNAGNSSNNSSLNLEPNTFPLTYTVQAGDSLWLIARKFNTTVDRIVSLNQLTSTGLRKGQKLIVGVRSDNIPSENNNNSTKSNALVFNYKFKISDSVGTSGKNKPTDVTAIQTQLYKLGFLDNVAFQKEKGRSSNIPQTIGAIRRFQQEVEGMESPNGQVYPNKNTLMFLNMAIVPSKQSSLSSLQQARQEFRVTIMDGYKIMGKDLSAPVGQVNNGNRPADLAKVQQRLMQLGYLGANHGEKYSSAVGMSKIPRTIRALRNFQKYRVKYWKTKTHLVGSQSYTEGVVYDNDLTHKLLREYSVYRITFPSLYNPAKRQAIEFHNYVKSWATHDLSGIAFIGNVKPSTLSLKEYEKTGLSKVEARGLQYVSSHEGNFDALNTYDKAIVSYGFIQFAGGTGGLPNMMALLKHLKPNTFRNRFQKYGIDVEYSITNGDIRKAHLVVTDPSTGRLLRQTRAESYIKSHKALLGAFVRAAYDIEVKRGQILSAKRRYVMPALNIKLDFTIPVVYTMAWNKKSVQKTYVGWRANNFKQTAEYRSLLSSGRISEKTLSFIDRPITEVIRSEMGITVLIDITVNQWINNTRTYFTDAIKKVATAQSLDTETKIRKINERTVLQEIVKGANTIASTRTKNILQHSSLSTWKG